MATKVGELAMVHSLTEEEHPCYASRLKGSPPPDPASINEECLSAAEEAAERVLNCVHPTLDSEEKRRDVIDFVQQVVKNRVNCEVVAYGSVPLKTYLPDGDIDLTVLKGPKVEESLVHDVLAVLHDEEQNESAEIEVKDIRFIDAEVKLVKCLVRSTVVDISFNQLGGLSTLCFLEQVDCLVGRNHLFKRSVILVKAWCYYESRIHGAHHGLLSTYALETLILYIFQLFHSSLRGPLSVLYRFLDYYSQFDWEKYGISLKGPVYNSCLPELAVKMPESGWKKLLTDDFLEESSEMFTVHSRVIETHPKAFRTKHLNIIDPLKENNNLGRSVHRGNFYRIRSALKYGARKLGQILLLPEDEINEEINAFFANTLSRNDNHYSSRLWPSALNLDDEESLTASSSSLVELLSEDDLPQKLSLGDFNNIDKGVEQASTFELTNDLDRYSVTDISSEMASEASAHETSKFGLRNGPSDHILSRSYSLPLSENYWSKPQYYSLTSAEYGSSEADRVDLTCDSDKLETDAMSEGGESEAFNPLVDLTGDFNSHIRSLLCAQLCHFSAPAVGNSPALLRSKNMKSRETVRESMPPHQNKFSQINAHLEEKQNAQGAGSFFPEMVHYTIRPSNWRYPNGEPGSHNHLHGYGHNNGLYPAYGELNSFVNVNHEDHPAINQYQEQRRSSGIWRQSPCSVGSQNQVNGYSSMGANLKAPGLRVATTQQGAAGQSVQLKKEGNPHPLLCASEMHRAKG